MSKIAVIGTGYVGLTTGAYLAHLGHEVICADVVPEKVERMSRGEVPIVEPGLEDLVKEGISEQRLSFVLGASAAVPNAEFVFLAVPTPQGEDGSADLSYVVDAAREIAPVLAPNTVVINKSTVPVGSAKLVTETINRSDISVVSNPEFLREGSAVYDSLNPDRIVIGSADHDAALRVAELFNKLSAPFVVTDSESAEMIKYASNAFLATKIGFVNAMANVCEVVGADINEVTMGMGYDKRIGFEFLRPGPGWGGSCFPKDALALVRIGQEAGYDFELLRSVITVNQHQYDGVTDKIRQAAGGTLQGKTVAVWGLTFKANTDDLRNSPALHIIDRLKAQGAHVRAYDITQTNPNAPGHPSLDGVEICADPYGVASGAHCLAVLTEWDEFRWLDFDKVASELADLAVVDGRNLLPAAVLKEKGFRYVGIGRS